MLSLKVRKLLRLCRSESKARANSRRFGLALVIGGLASLLGCGGGAPAETPSSVRLLVITVTSPGPTIPMGFSQQLTAVGTYSDGTTHFLTSTATWTSLNPLVATISNSGLATGLTPGSTTIQAASGSVSGSTALTVTAATLISMAVAPANPSIPKGATEQFTATGSYTDGSTQNLTNTVTWTSLNPAVATISNSGLATGLAPGSTTIQAASGSVSGSTALTVTAATLVSMAVAPANPSIPKGATEQFTATGSYTDGSTQNLTNTVTWTSLNPAVATISNSGLATGLAPGSTTIQAASGSVSGSTALTVTAATLVSIAVAPANPSIPKGATEQFIATGSYTDGSAQNLTNSATWTSSNPSVATISNSGLATGLAP